MKFGGSCLQSREGLLRMTDLVRSEPRPLVIVLSALKRTRILDRATAARLSQRPERIVGNTLSRMLELGYLERVGAGRSTAYRLSGRVYEMLGSKVSYFRDRGLSRRRMRALIMEVVGELGQLSAEECQELCGVTPAEAAQLFATLVEEGQLRREGDAWVMAASAL